MKTIEINTYTAKELKELFPKSFKRAYEKHKETQYSFGLSWGDEMIESLKQCVKVLGYELKNYALGDSSCRGNHIRLNEYSEIDDMSQKEQAAITEKAVNKYVGSDGYYENITGYCLDHNLMEIAVKAIQSGSTIREAITSDMLDAYVSQVDAEWEDQLSEERFIDESDANEIMFTEDGGII